MAVPERSAVVPAKGPHVAVCIDRESVAAATNQRAPHEIPAPKADTQQGFDHLAECQNVVSVVRTLCVADAWRHLTLGDDTLELPSKPSWPSSDTPHENTTASIGGFMA
jgi:hypothetical protein